jgi:hypothetical protein
VNGELAVYFGSGHKVPKPGPFQRALLAKKTLTFADYQSAMQAAADCIQQKVPGATVRIVPQPGWTQVDLFTITLGGGAATGSLTQGTGSGPAPSSATRNSDGSVTTTSSGSTTPVTTPSVLTSSLASQGYCIATYSAHVEARWQVMQILSGPQLSAQRGPFLQCMRTAGITVPANTSNLKLGQIFNDPATYAKLTTGEMQRSDACTTRFQRFLFSIAAP